MPKKIGGKLFPRVRLYIFLPLASQVHLLMYLNRLYLKNKQCNYMLKGAFTRNRAKQLESVFVMLFISLREKSA